MPEHRDEPTDWIDLLVSLASRVGMNPVRARWKLERLRKRLGFEAKAARDRAAHIRYEHKTCGECGALCDRDERTCPRCGERLTSRRFQVIQRIGLAVPATVTVSMVLCLALVVIYVRMLADAGGASPAGWFTWSFDGALLVRYGGSWPPAIAGGQWWRLGTCIFLHAGIWHIGFNTFALWQIGPPIEELFGRGRTLALFMVTGVAASSASYLFLDGVGIGASGAIMGLIGLAAGWGHRDGTTAGRDVRNRMVKWAIYVMVFGFFIGADNVAHAAGFLAGAALGWVMPTRRQVALPPAADLVAGLLGGGAAATCMVLCLFPPQRSALWAEDLAPHDTWVDVGLDEPTVEGLIEYHRSLVDVCPDVRAGRFAMAQATLQARWELGTEWWDLFDEAERRTYMLALCDGLDHTLGLCARIDAEGTGVLFEDGLHEGGDREATERQWLQLCEALTTPADGS